LATAAMIPPPRWTIPPFASGADIVRRVGHLYRPQEKLTLTEWSIRSRNYDPDILPWQPEVMDMLSDPETSEGGIMKPAQCGATLIGTNWLGYIVDTDPSETLVCQPDRTMAEKFVKGRLDPMIDETKSVKDKLSPVANANNQWVKLFRGMMLTTVWPVAAQFTQLSIRYGWLDDYDQYDDNIGAVGGEGGQGSGIGLLDGRFISHEGREKKYISSSPAKGERGGIEAFVSDGTDERLQPACVQCGERFEIDLLRDLQFDASGTADLAEKTAVVVCPTNGCVMLPGDRRKLLATLTDLPQRGFVSANPLLSKRRRTFRIDGLMALPSWPVLARKWRAAQISWEARQDESDLRTFINTQAGKNYRSKMSGEKPLDADELGKRRERGLFIGQIPAGVKVWVIVVDVQHNRLECMAYGWGDGLEGWIIDRWSIDVLDDGLTSLAPLTHPEHSAVLLPLFAKRYPLADGSGMSPPPLTVQLDVGGGGIKGEGATGFAKTFWEAARALGVHRSRITLTKGGNTIKGELMPRAKFADQKSRGGAKRSSAELWLPNVHRIKGTIDVRLRRTDVGPGYIHLPGGKTGGDALRAGQDEGSTGRLLDTHVDEITAEEVQKGLWKKVRPRNETWDLLVAAYAAILRPPFAQSRTHMKWVPVAYRVPDQGLALAEPVAGPADTPAAQPATAPKVKNRKINPLTGKARGSHFGARR
jgi:phage terminase large subunit GpA-like protein